MPFQTGHKPYLSAGRPKGQLNKFTSLKSDLLAVWTEIDGKAKLINYLSDRDPKKFFQYLELIVRLLPKEEHLEDGARLIGQRIRLLIEENKSLRDAQPVNVQDVEARPSDEGSLELTAASTSL